MATPPDPPENWRQKATSWWRRGSAKPLAAADLFTAACRAMEERKKIFRSATLAPEHYTITLSEQDFQRFAPLVEPLAAEIRDELAAYRNKRGYQGGEITVHLEQNQNLPPGTPAVSGTFTAVVT